MNPKIKEKVLREPVTEEEHKTFMDLFKDEFGHPTEIPSEFERMIAFSRCMVQKSKDKIEDLEYELLAYRRPRGTSVVNVREDEKKKTLAEVGKVIDEKISILKTGCQVLVNQIKKLKGEKKKFVFKQAEFIHIRIEELEELKQKLGIK